MASVRVSSKFATAKALLSRIASLMGNAARFLLGARAVRAAVAMDRCEMVKGEVRAKIEWEERESRVVLWLLLIIKGEGIERERKIVKRGDCVVVTRRRVGLDTRLLDL